MNWKNVFERRKYMKAIQIIQLTWMAFAVFALGIALPGIPQYLTLLQPWPIPTRAFGFPRTSFYMYKWQDSCHCSA
jgi:hypothetical protein